MNNLLLYALAVPLFSASGGLAALRVFGNGHCPAWLGRGLAALGLCFGGLGLYGVLFQPDGLHFGFVTGLMCVMWVASLAAFAEGFAAPVAVQEMVLFPLCGLVFSLPFFAPQESVLPVSGAWMFRLHLVVAIAAYSLLGIAALHAGIMAWQEKVLHRPAHDSGRRFQERLLDQLPSLVAMESTLFRQLWAGFVLLSFTLLTGVVFAERWSGQALAFDHKTVFAVVSWVSFACLLGGRLLAGWRGRQALRWCLGSYAVLVLAYFGTQFVFEFILKQGV
ncbi:MAG: cytochrome c biogenesis protein CcsA [Limnobacter sp.]|nr:cytochrome c biogenesis protein CcsA [Limnobacter sp.]